MRIRFVALLLASVCATSCTRRDARRESTPLAGTLRLSMYNQSVDWQMTDNRLIDNVMDGLVRYDFSNGKVALKPALATRWSTPNGGRTWIFHLRGDVTWTDGAKFGAQDVVDAWRRLLDPQTASPVAYFLFPVRNARAINTGRAPTTALGVRPGPGRTLEVELETPVAFFPYLLTNGATYPIRTPALARHGDRWTEPANLVTLGAYRLVEKEVGNVTRLVRNETYYGAAEMPAGTPSQVVVYVARDEAEHNLFQAGKTDLIYYLSAGEVRAVGAETPVGHAPVFGVSYLAFGTPRPPVDASLVRRALAHAIDKNEVVQVLGPSFRPLSSWVPPGLLGFERDLGPKFSVAKAKALLARAGYADPARLPRLELAFYDHGDQALAENVQYQLKRNLGVEVDVRYQDFKTLAKRTGRDMPHLAVYGWNLDFPDPDNMFNLVIGGAGNNHTGWASAAYDRMVARAASLPEEGRRRRLYHDAQTLLLDTEVPVVPLYALDHAFLTGPRIATYVNNPLGKLLFRNVTLK